MNKIANLLKQQRSELFSETATLMKTTLMLLLKKIFGLYGL